MRPFVILFLLLPFILAGCKSHTQPKSEAQAGEAYQSFTGNGAWCWFSDPRAIYHEGKRKATYAGWVDSLGNIVIACYDHNEGTMRSHILHERLERDDHDNPSFFMDNEGKLMVFYSKHSTGNSPIYLARAREPESIDAWEPVQTLRLNDTTTYAGFSNTYTYTNIVQLSEEDNKLYLFWRGADFKPNFSVSSDNGKTWDRGKILILPERIYRDRRPYIKISSNGKDEIHFAFTDGHPHVEPTNSIYYMKYRNGELFKANGEKIGDWSALPVDPGKTDVVYDAKESKEKSWIWDIAQTKDGSPVVVYATFPTDTTHVYHYGIFTDGRWNNHRLTEAGSWFPHTRPGVREREPNYSGGIVLDHNDPSIAYLSKEHNGVFEIEKWSTKDRGTKWDVTAVTRNSRFDNVRPFVIRNHPGDSLSVLWMNLQEYIHYTDYQSEIKMSISK